MHAIGCISKIHAPVPPTTRIIPAPSSPTAQWRRLFFRPITGMRFDRPARLLSVLREDHSENRLAVVRPRALIIGSHGWEDLFPEEPWAPRSKASINAELGGIPPERQMCHCDSPMTPRAHCLLQTRHDDVRLRYPSQSNVVRDPCHRLCRAAGVST